MVRDSGSGDSASANGLERRRRARVEFMEDDLRTSDVDRGLRTSEMNVAPTLWGVVAASARLNAFASLYGMLLWVESDLATAFYRSWWCARALHPPQGVPRAPFPT